MEKDKESAIKVKAVTATRPKVASKSKNLTATKSIKNSEVDPPVQKPPAKAEKLYFEIKGALHGEVKKESSNDGSNKLKLCDWHMPEDVKKAFCEPTNCKPIIP